MSNKNEVKQQIDNFFVQIHPRAKARGFLRSYRVKHWKKIAGRTVLHREDGPAVIGPCGTAWFINGQRHRVDGPAVEFPDGTHHWCLNGKLHRVDGPAIIDVTGSVITPWYYVNGIWCPERASYEKVVAVWLSYRGVTRDEITSLIGNFRIVEWE